MISCYGMACCAMSRYAMLGYSWSISMCLNAGHQNMRVACSTRKENSMNKLWKGNGCLCTPGLR